MFRHVILDRLAVKKNLSLEEGPLLNVLATLIEVRFGDLRPCCDNPVNIPIV